MIFGKEFPIQCYGTIPWSLAEEAHREYEYRYHNHQTLQDLARRGGFSIEEMDLFVPGWREKIEPIRLLEDQLARAVAHLTCLIIDAEEQATRADGLSEEHYQDIGRAKVFLGWEGQ